MLTTDILNSLKNYKADKSIVYGIEALGLFGSAARGEQTAGSDIDVCVKLNPPSFFNRMAIQEELEHLFHCKVDVISLGAVMRPLFKKNLEKDAIYV